MVLKADTTFLDVTLNVSTFPNNLQYTSRFSVSEALEYEKHTTPILHLVTSLFRIHSTIAKEAAQIFYSQNTFGFFDGFYWTDVLHWLRIIGPRNQASLRNLCLNLEKEPSGIPHTYPHDQEDVSDDLERRIYRGEWGLKLEDLFLKATPHVSSHEQELEKLEQLFQILGLMTDFPKVVVTISLGYNLGPGEVRVRGRRTRKEKLPVEMYKYHTLHTSREGKREVEIVCMGVVATEEFRDRSEWIKATGWELVKMAEKSAGYFRNSSVTQVEELLSRGDTEKHFMIVPSSMGIVTGWKWQTPEEKKWWKDAMAVNTGYANICSGRNT